MIIAPDSQVALASRASLAAAAGWLGGWAQAHLRTEVFLERAVHFRDQMSIEFVFQLDVDIRRACEAEGVKAPKLSEFFLVGRHPLRNLTL